MLHCFFGLLPLEVNCFFGFFPRQPALHFGVGRAFPFYTDPFQTLVLTEIVDGYPLTMDGSCERTTVLGNQAMVPDPT